jgi:hypothetical protein
LLVFPLPFCKEVSALQIYFVQQAFNFVLLCQSVEADRTGIFGADTQRDLIYFISCFVVGILGGLVLTCIWKFGLFAIGCLLGWVLAAVILSFSSQGLISAGIGRTIFMIIMSIVFGIAILFLEKPLLVLGTAIPGAYAMTLGIDIFAMTGFATAARAFLSGSNSFTLTTKVWILFGVFVFLSLVGVIHQFRELKKDGHHKGLMYRDQDGKLKH